MFMYMYHKGKLEKKYYFSSVWTNRITKKTDTSALFKCIATNNVIDALQEVRIALSIKLSKHGLYLLVTLCLLSILKGSFSPVNIRYKI